MAITPIGTTTNSGNSGTAFVALPSGGTTDDLLEVILHLNGPVTSSDGNGTNSFTEQLVDRAYNGPSAQFDHYYRFYTGSEAGTLYFPLSSSNRWSIVCTLDRGVDTSTPYDVAPGTASENTGFGATNTTNQLVTVTDGALMKSYAGNDSNSITFGTTPSGWNVIANLSGQQLLAVVSKSMTTAGTQSAISYEQSSSNGEWLNNIYALKPAASGTTYETSLTDSMGLTDSLGKVSTYTRNDVNSLGISDNTSISVTYTRSQSNDLGIEDNINTSASYIRSNQNSIGMDDSITSAITFNKSLSDSLGLTDVVDFYKLLERSVNDSLGITDNVSLQTTYNKSVLDSVALSDNVTKQSSIVRDVLDVLGLLDLINSNSTFSKSVVDAVGISDAVAFNFILVVSLNDSIGLSDSVTKTSNFVQDVADDIGIQDYINKISGYSLSLSDSLGISDVINRQLTSVRSLVESMSLDDVNDESTSTEDFTSFVGNYIGAFYLGMYSPSFGEIVETELSLVDSVSISDTINVIIGTDFGYNPDITIEDVLQAKISLVGVSQEAGLVGDVIEKKVSINISDIKQSVSKISDYKTTIDQV